MSSPDDALAELVCRDPRYAREAYEFLSNALQHTLEGQGPAPERTSKGSSEPVHVTGQRLVEGIRDLALQEYGLMACAVFRSWGIHTTDDFGEMVYNLIDAGLMHKTDEDSKEDFHNLFDFDEAFRQYEIKVEDQIGL